MVIDPWEEIGDAPTIVTFDQGGVSGWSVWTVHPEALVDSGIKILDNIELHNWGQIDARGQDAEVACIKEEVQIVRAFPGCAVLMEDFILRMYSKSRDLLAPVRLNAMLDYALEVELGIQVTHRQQPSEAKTVVTDERLKLWGFYNSAGGQEHARDADRHAILFLRKAKDPAKGALRRAAWWPHIYGPAGPYYVAPKKNRMISLKDSPNLTPAFQPPRTGKPIRVRTTRKRTG